MDIKEYLRNHRLLTDGSMGTYYSELVNQPGAISEFANLTAPEIIEQIHLDYIQAGARILRTNTFVANRFVLLMEEEKQRELLKAACRIAKKAAAGSKALIDGEELLIFGDIGPIPEDAGTDEEETLKEYQLMCEVFLEEGVDGIHFETFSGTSYIEKLAPYLKERKPELFLMASFSINRNGYTGSGISANRLMEKISKVDEIDACGFNCGVGSGHMYQILKKVNFPQNKLIYAAPNAGYPEQMQNRMVFIDNAKYFAENMVKLAELGVDILGSCCGTTPEYTGYLTKLINLKEHVSVRRTESSLNGNVISSIRENDFYRLFQKGKKVIAVELDPPYDAKIDQVMECAHQLKAGGADIITFADSPMGRSRVDSILMSIKIAEETGLRVMPHICCRDRNMISMRSVLLGGYVHGLRNLLIVTGDPVPGESRVSTTGVFDYNSIQLMEYVKEMNVEHFASEPFCYGGALNQSRGTIDKVVERMKRKIDSGASYFLTQPIFCEADAHRIRSIKERVDTKILCGIMPLVSYRNASFIKNEISGIHIPDEIVNRYTPDMSKEEAELVGASIAREMMSLLDDVADGYYFMLPFNRVSLMQKILGK